MTWELKQLHECISALAPQMVLQTEKSHSVQVWALPRRRWAPKFPLNPREIKSASHAAGGAQLLTKWGCLWGKLICALTHLFYAFGNSSGQPPLKLKEALPLILVRVWLIKGEIMHRLALKSLYTTSPKRKKCSEAQKNMTWKCQGQGKDVCP